MIKFKRAHLQEELEQASPRMQALITAAGAYMFFTYEIDLTITDVMREDKKSVHYAGNGVDFRTTDLTQEQGSALVKFIKGQFPYYMKLPMPKRPKYSVKDERKEGSSKGWTGPHIHAQVNWREA